MSLLDQEVKKEKSKGKNIVLLLLIISVLLLIFAIVAMVALSGKTTKQLILSINDENIKIEDGLLTEDEDGVLYISIQKIANKLGYNYNTGGYKKYNEDATNTECYLENEKQIVQFELDSNKIYKTSPESYLDFEEYQLKHKIIKVDNMLYIALEDDLPIALSTVYSYSQNENKIILNTVENLTEKYKASLEEKQNTISEEYENQKAIVYNMLVISNESGKWGVLNRDFISVIGNKYESIKFVEQAGTFIVSDDGKYGVISSEANKKPVIDLNYEEINVVSNSPLCYEVRLGNKSVIVDKDGKPVINASFDSVGCRAEGTTEGTTFVIENVGKEKITALVICREGKYGLINLNEGKEIGTAVLDKVYSKNENGEKKYYVQIKEQEQEQGQELSLDSYIEKINTTTVNVGG